MFYYTSDTQTNLKHRKSIKLGKKQYSMNPNITITKDNRVIYTTKPSQETIRFKHNNLQIETEYHDKLIQTFFTKKILDCDILPLQYNQTIIPQTPITKLKNLKSVDITLEEELSVVIKSNKVIYSTAVGFVKFKEISQNLKIDIRRNDKNSLKETHSVSDKMCCIYQNKNALPINVIVLHNKIIVENNESNVSHFELLMPVKKNVYHVKFKSNHGKAVFDIEKELITWKIDRLVRKKTILEYELCATNSIDVEKKQMIAKVYFEISPLKNSGIDILKVYDDEGTKDGYVQKRMKVKNYEMRL